MCANIECIIIIINRTFISTIVEVKKKIIKISIRDIELKIYHFDEYAIFTFYIKKVLSNNARAFA